MQPVECIGTIAYWASKLTSTAETSTAAIIPNEWLALKIGEPHWKGYGIFILKSHVSDNISEVKNQLYIDIREK